MNNVHLFDKNRIIKIENINEIFDIFYKERYNLYIQRKKYILSNLFNELEILTNKIRFIGDIINKNIIIFKKKKDEIIQELLKNNYKQVKDKKVLDTNNVKDKDTFDYLIKMSLYSFTEEEIDKLQNELNKVQFEYDELKDKTIEEIWLNECNQLMKQYRKIKLNV